MANRPRGKSSVPVCVVLLSTFLLFPSCGGSGYGGGGGGGGPYPPSAPTGLAAAAGNQQVSLTWNASSGATTYNVKRATTSGGPYTQVANGIATNDTDASLTNGTTYYYVVSAVNSAGESANSSQVSATPGVVPAVPTGLTATAGNQQVSLTWTASAGATSYNVKRSTTSGGPYTTVASPTGTSQADSGLTNGTTYYYVVSAVNATGESLNSSQVSAAPAASTNVAATINVLANRHTISPYVYGGAFPESTAKITDSGLSVVRWGGNASSTYNWQLYTYNADNDYYFEDFNFFGVGDGNKGMGADANSTQFITDVKAAGSAPLMTMVMLPWVAQSAEAAGASGNGHWSFPQTEYPNQCAFDPYNSDAGNGIVAGTCNNNPQSFITATATDLNRTYFPLLDGPPQAGDPANSVYRNQWATALATAFGGGTCTIPYFQISSCHFYDMDNEIDIWGGTHRDVHPNPATYAELRDIFVKESTALKGWDPAAVRLGPVSCCWYFYWRSATGGSDTTSHAGVDFLPWWLNEVAWADAVSGSRSLNMFDIHAYPDGPDTTNFTTAQKQALATRIYRDWWDPTYTSEATYIANGGFSIEPVDSKTFRIPRMRALVNQIYPGTAFSITEWSAAIAGESDFSTALGDVDGYGLLGRERVQLATRWTAPQSTNPNYQALKLFTNYDGAHHGFGTTSVLAAHRGDPNLFSLYAATNAAGTALTIMVVNKDPANAVQVTFTMSGFTPANVTSYTLSQASPNSITASSSQAWSATQTFAPYSATLLIVSGSTATVPTSEWDLNPDTIMVPAGGTVMLNPVITSGTTNVALSGAAFDVFEGAAACTGGTITLTTSTITTATNGQITVNAPSTPGFCHFSVTGTDGTATQTQGGWIVVGKPAATLAPTSGNQSGSVGTQLTVTATLTPGSSGGTASGASVLFSTTATGASLSNGTTSGAKVIAVTNSSGVASVTLTLPGTAQVVTVNAEGPYGLGHPETTYTETAH